MSIKGKATNTNNKRRKDRKTMPVFDHGIHYIKYSILKATGEEVSLKILRLAVKYLAEYIVQQLILDRMVGFLGFGVFDTNIYPDSLKKDCNGVPHFVPAFHYPTIRFGRAVRRALKSGDYDCLSPEFLSAEPKDYKALYEKVRPINYNEFGLPEDLSDQELGLDTNEAGEPIVFYEKGEVEDCTIRIPLD